MNSPFSDNDDASVYMVELSCTKCSGYVDADAHSCIHCSHVFTEKDKKEMQDEYHKWLEVRARGAMYIMFIGLCLGLSLYLFNGW